MSASVLVEGRSENFQVSVLEDPDIFPEFGSFARFAAADSERHPGLFTITVNGETYPTWHAIRARDGTTSIYVQDTPHYHDDELVIYAYRYPLGEPHDRIQGELLS